MRKTFHWATETIIGETIMRPTILKLSLSATLVWFACGAEPQCASGQPAGEMARTLIDVQHNHRGSDHERYLLAGDPLSLYVSAASDADVFVYVLYHDADGDPVLLFPNPWERDNRFRASSRRQIPGRESGITFCIQPPFGHESLQIIASVRPLPELEGKVQERPGPLPVLTPEELDQWCQKWLADPSIEVHLSKFQTRPTNAHEHLHNGPELVQ
jgi:hypothetical protein